MHYRFGPLFPFLAVLLLASCGGGGSGGGDSPAAVNISGRITYDYVPVTVRGLNYDATEARPARGLKVNLLNRDDSVVASTTTDALGNYQVTVDANTVVKVRVLAELSRSGSPRYNFKVTDNTQGNSLYGIEGEFASSGNRNSSRDLHAESGWGGERYTGVRAAAPFAIIDTVYSSLQLLLTAEPGISLPDAELRWSVNNRAATGSEAVGNITTSKFVAAQSAIYILGSEDSDTDEYDAHVVAHEFGHYFEYALSRSDSIGGSHSINEELDMRVAFGEGYANAFSAIVLEDPVYKDSFQNMQAIAAVWHVDDSDIDLPGWYSEASIQSIIYNLYNNDAERFKQIYTALRSNDYINADALTGIHLFTAIFKQVAPPLAATMDDLLAEQNIVGNDMWASGETNNGGVASVLPLYKNVAVNSDASVICSSRKSTVDEGNKLGNRQYGRVQIATRGQYKIDITRDSGSGNADPDFLISQGGVLIGSGLSVNTTESELVTLEAGNAVIEVMDFRNIDGLSNTGGTSCFNVSVTLE